MELRSYFANYKAFCDPYSFNESETRQAVSHNKLVLLKNLSLTRRRRGDQSTATTCRNPACLPPTTYAVSKPPPPVQKSSTPPRIPVRRSPAAIDPAETINHDHPPLMDAHQPRMTPEHSSRISVTRADTILSPYILRNKYRCEYIKTEKHQSCQISFCVQEGTRKQQQKQHN